MIYKYRPKYGIYTASSHCARDAPITRPRLSRRPTASPQRAVFVHVQNNRRRMAL